MTRRSVPLVFSVSLAWALTLDAWADAPREARTPPPNAKPLAALPARKAETGLVRRVLEAYRKSQLATAEDYYGAAAVLATSKDARDNQLARDLGMAAMDKGFGPGYRLALGAHRRMMRAMGLRKDAGPEMRAPKRFALAPTPKPSPAVAAT